MKVGIVGSEEKYWTRELKEKAIKAIESILGEKDILVSGGCHLGGVDIWAEEVADRKGLEKIIFPAKQHRWYYYKKRNIKIAETADIVVDIEPGDRDSGGMWTLKYAESLKKYTNIVRIR